MADFDPDKVSYREQAWSEDGSSYAIIYDGQNIGFANKTDDGSGYEYFFVLEPGGDGRRIGNAPSIDEAAHGLSDYWCIVRTD